MGFHGILLIFYIGAMMFLAFYFIYSIFSRSAISARMLFLVISLLIFMSLGTVIASYVIFWHGNVEIGFSVLIISAVVAGMSFRIKDREISWRDEMRYTAILVVALIFYDFSMGYVYASAIIPHNANPILMAINNPDFSLMMVIDGVFFFAISEKRKDSSEYALITFALSMAVMPNFYIQFSKAILLLSTIISSMVMIVNIVLLYIMQMKRKTFDIQLLAISLAGSDFLMMLGLSSFALNRSLILISSAMIVSMFSYFLLVTHRFSRKIVKRNYSFTFILLVLINGAELAMSMGVTSFGMSLSDAIFPKSTINYAFSLASFLPGMIHSIDFSNPLWWLFPFDPIKMASMAFDTGLSVNLPFAYFWASFMLLMATTMSPFYAIMMGSEMSYLVLERYRTTKKKSVRNWSLAIIAGIPLFVILIPFYTPYYIFGMSGMLFAVPLAALLISLVAIIIAAALFGRRAQCNLVCMAAHMWTNVYYDQFRPPKNSSAWSYLRWLFFVLMLASFSFYALQQTGILPMIKLGKIMINPLDFYGMFVLNYVWWFFYFLTPVFGSYSCARHGWCGFGTLAGLFNKVFFKIRSANANECKSCTNRNCESSCPTAIPLHGDFLRNGYSNRISCIGCGNCVESCPIGNIAIIDARDRLMKRTRKQ